jgi:hypothetical protein
MVDKQSGFMLPDLSSKMSFRADGDIMNEGDQNTSIILAQSLEAGPSMICGGDQDEPLKPGHGMIHDHLDLGLDESDSSYD